MPELRRLVARLVDIDLADYDGRTALHLGASEGRYEALRYLIALGANQAVVDRWGNTPLDDGRLSQDGPSIGLLTETSS